MCHILRDTSVSSNVSALLADIAAGLQRTGWANLGIRAGDSVLDRFGITMPGQFRKLRVQVNLEFCAESTWRNGIFLLQFLFSREAIDTGIVIVPNEHFVGLLQTDVVSFERVSSELRWAEMFITVPILVIGVQPVEIGPIRTCYKQTSEAFMADRVTKGEKAAAFEDRIHEERPPDDSEIPQG